MNHIQPLRKVLWLVLLTVSHVCLAHNSLQSSEPAADATVDVAPETLMLTFSDPAWPNEITVTDKAGNDVVADMPEALVSATVFSIPLKPDMVDGEYTVNWSVEGDDTHIITGEFSFTLDSVVSEVGADGNPQ
jgi:methionine-rich copper-binding protein CopC